MNTTEDRARAAMRAIASTVDDVPPPLRLTPATDAPARRRAPAPPRGWRTWLIPAAAALAVLAVGIGLVLVRGASDDRITPATPTAASSVPAFYVVLGSAAGDLLLGEDLYVARTSTGAVMAIVPSPRGTTFFGVAASADDRTFVIAAKQGDNSPQGQYLSQSWYLLRIGPDGKPAGPLAKLPIPPMPDGTSVEGMALSPDGSRLAVAVQPGAAANADAAALLRIYSVATGAAIRTWTAPHGLRAFTGRTLGSDPTNVLSWVDGDRGLAFTSWWRTAAATPHGPPTDHMTIRVLDVTRAGTDLMGDSRVVWSTDTTGRVAGTPHGLGCSADFTDALITGDGSTVVCGALSLTDSPGDIQTWTVAWLEYSTATGKLARTLPGGTVSGKAMDLFETGLPVSLLWADASGATVIGYWAAGTTHNPTGENFPIDEYDVFGLQGHTPLPTPLGNRGAIIDVITW